MGIRTLHRQTAPAQATTDATASTPPPSVPPFAAAASTARVPTDLATTLRGAATDLRQRLTRLDWRRRAEQATRLGWRRRAEQATRLDWRRRAEQARGCLALLLTTLPRSRPVRTVTVFVATTATVTDRPDGSAPAQDRAPGPDATP
ncbi:hypothetical protein [Streptomyces sp. NPDC020489]|uniref:hypothetical protein n=1 Tax=Streptomyces sp. NPDC020489 TaxID=3365077 RepID=UPI0037A4FEAB